MVVSTVLPLLSFELIQTLSADVDDFIVDELDLTAKEVDKYNDLQMAAVVVKIDCPG